MCTGVLLSLAVSAGFAFQGDIEEALVGDGLSGGLLPVSAGNIAAAALWSTSLWFVSPLQLLLLFLGKIETERPSDWFMNIVARANGLPTEDLAYEHPAWVKAAAAVAIIASGCSIAVVLDTGLGDATWGVSSGIATCMAAGVYELGRPQRLSADEAVELEEQWQVFGASLQLVWCRVFRTCSSVHGRPLAAADGCDRSAPLRGGFHLQLNPPSPGCRTQPRFPGALYSQNSNAVPHSMDAATTCPSAPSLLLLHSAPAAHMPTEVFVALD